jgi:hypothetical protein
VALWPAASYQPVSTAGGVLAVRGVCLHHQAGNGNPAAVYVARRVSAHFWIPKVGRPVQHVDTAIAAWHGGTAALNSGWIGVETEGCPVPPYAEPLTENQIIFFGQLMVWARGLYGVPLALSESTATPGLGYHRMAGGYPTGCPCDVRLSQRAAILAAAGASWPPVPVPPPATATERVNMTLTDPVSNGLWVAQPDGAVWTYDGAPYLGGANTANPGDYPCVGIALWASPGGAGPGYVVTLDWGQGVGRPPGYSADGGERYRRYHFPRR